MSSVRGKLFKGTAWIAMASAITNLLGLCSTLVLARLLTPADFGLVALATTIMSIVSTCTDLSLGSALVQHPSLTDDHIHTAWTLGLARNGGIGLILLAAAFPLAAAYHAPQLVAVIAVFALSLLIQGLANPQAIIMMKNLVFWQQSMFQISQKLAALVVAVAIALVYRSYWALVWGALAASVVSAALSYLVLPLRPRFNLSRTKELMGFSVWLSLGQIVNTVNWNFDQLLVGGMLGRTALGYYTVGNNLAMMPTREATAPITGALFPAFANLASDRHRLAAAYQSAQALVTSIALPVGVGMALVADPLIHLVVGAKWEPSIFLIQALASNFAIQTLGNLSQPLAMAAGQTQLLFKRDLQGFVMRLPMVLAGILLGGMTGLIYARLLAGLIVIVFHMQVVKRITSLTIAAQLGANMRSLTSIAVMALVTLGATPSVARLGRSAVGLAEQVALLVSIGAVTYVSCHLALWVVQAKPKGPESEILSMASKIFETMRAARRAASRT